MNYKNITDEQKLVLHLAHYNNPQYMQIKDLVEKKLNWIEVLGNLVYNRTAGIAYKILSELSEIIGNNILFSLFLNYESQRIRTDVFKKETIEISKVFIDSGIQHAFLKGAVLANIMYPTGLRVSKDIDILVGKKSLTECSNILKRIGFTQGRYDIKNNKVVPASRKEIIRSRMNYGEIVPFIKLCEEPGLNCINIDVNFSLDWKAKGSEELTSVFLDNTELYYTETGDPICSLSPEYFLAHLCMHLYKEAVGLAWVQSQRDLGLYKFVDIYSFITSNSISVDWNLFKNIVLEDDIIHECYLALEYTRTLFPIISKNKEFTGFMKEIKPGNVDYLDQVIDTNNPEMKYCWQQDFLQRFFDIKRSDFLKEI